MFFFLKAADSLKTRGGPGRNNELLIEIAISKMAAQHEVYLATREEKCPVSRQVLLVLGMEIRDRYFSTTPHLQSSVLQITIS